MTNLLLVERDPGLRYAVELALDGPVRIFDVASGEEALRVLRSVRFDLVVIDAGAPAPREFVDQLRRDPVEEVATTPVIVAGGTWHGDTPPGVAWVPAPVTREALGRAIATTTRIKCPKF